MYGPLWRRLPGPWPVKALQSAVVVLAVVAACFLWVFPVAAPYMPFNDTTVDEQSTQTSTSSPTSSGTAPTSTVPGSGPSTASSTQSGPTGTGRASYATTSTP